MYADVLKHMQQEILSNLLDKEWTPIVAGRHAAENSNMTQKNLAEAQNDNDFICNEQVPDISTLEWSREKNRPKPGRSRPR